MPWVVPAAVALIVLAGFALRLAASRGDLWLDEIWSLNLVTPIGSAGEVFWGISHDNNHFLNSLWLYEAGPGRPPITYRLASVLFGTLSVLVAARIGLRRDGATGLAAATLTAFSFPLVNYGSEARGYAGLILAILAAIDSLEQAVARRLDPKAQEAGSEDRYRWTLGLAIGLGALSHLTMLAATAALGLAAAIGLHRPGQRPIRLLGELAHLFAPSALLLVPAFAALMAGVVLCHGFTMGGAEPFSFAQFVDGYGGLLRFAAGLPPATPFWAVFGLAAALVLAAWRLRLLQDSRLALLFGTAVMVPGIMLAGRLPNLAFPRYFLAAGVVLLLCQAEVFGKLWNGSRRRRWAAAALLVCVTGGQFAPLASLLRDGRGSPSAALAWIKSEGGGTYASNRSFATRMVVDFLAPKAGARLTSVESASFCEQRPDWYIDSIDDGSSKPERLELGPEACKTFYVRRALFPASALSGLPWTLYRREG